MAAVRGWAGRCGAITLVAALAACSAAPDAPDAPDPRPATAPAATSAGLGDAPPAAPKDVSEAHFVTPSGNIGCYLDKSGARCDIVRKNWQPPPAPDDCELDWGAGLSVHEAEEASFTCAGDTVLGGKDELGYGRSVRAGEFVCSSERTAMRCENTESGHGFTLASGQYNLF